MRETLTGRIEAARLELAALRPGAWPASVLEASAERRAVVEYRSAGERVIGKFREDGSGEATFRLLVSIEASGTSTLRVPRPICWCPGPRALLTEGAPGESCRGLDPSRSAPALERIGRALSELHGLALATGPAKRLGEHLSELVRPAPGVLAQAFPEHAGRIHDTLDRLRAAEAAWGELPAGPLHRDFHLRQIFDDGRHVTVIDWDDAASGDPAFDVGYFVTYLETHYEVAAAEAGVAAFRAGYGGDAATWARVPEYGRFNLLRRACRRYRLRDAGWERELAAMMARLGSAE